MKPLTLMDDLPAEIERLKAIFRATGRLTPAERKRLGRASALLELARNPDTTPDRYDLEDHLHDRKD
jgi:hypothetical protein